MAVLEIKDLHVSRDGKEILKGINLKTGPGEVHAIMGPNGSGKSTLAYTLLAHPKYIVTKGDILLDGQSMLQRDVSSIAGITEVTIRNRCKEILTAYKIKVTLRPSLVRN